MRDPKPGDVLIDEDGNRLKVDAIWGGEVYFWRIPVGELTVYVGSDSLRMKLEIWREATRDFRTVKQ